MSLEPLPEVGFAGGYGKRYPRRGHYILHAFIGVASLVVTCLVLRAILPPRNIPEVTPKLRYFAQHKNEFDTVFVGSSRMERHIVPEIFDRVSAGDGFQTRSFNLGIGGMHPPESFYVLNELLGTRPAGLKWVFLELEELYPPWIKEDTSTLRSVYWHNWAMTRLVLAKIVNPDGHRPWHWILSKAAFSRGVHAHVALFLKNVANVGRAKDLVERDADAIGAAGDFDRDRGYNPHKQVPEDAERYEGRLRRWSARRPSIDPETDRGYRDCANQVRAAGGEPVFVVPPNPSESELRFSDSNSAPAPVLAFNQREKYSQLYESRMRTDPQHLTAAGAQLFTRLLAERFVTEVAPAK